jgi:hypothetical protein
MTWCQLWRLHRTYNLELRKVSAMSYVGSLILTVVSVRGMANTTRMTRNKSTLNTFEVEVMGSLTGLVGNVDGGAEPVSCQKSRQEQPNTDVPSIGKVGQVGNNQWQDHDPSRGVRCASHNYRVDLHSRSERGEIPIDPLKSYSEEAPLSRPSSGPIRMLSCL